MKNQRGVTMIEVLIALVIFAIGVGGMAGLQLRSLSMSVDATQRAVVLAKSQELADRIRVNSAALNTYINNGPYSDADDTYCAAPPTDNCADSTVGVAVSCDNTQLATFDLWDVFCRPRTGMNASVIDWTTTVSCAVGPTCTGPQDVVNITTSWVSKTADTDSELSAAPVADQVTLSFIP